MMTPRHDVGPVDKIAPNEMKCVLVEATRILLANVDGTIYATSDICSHALAYLSDGFLDGSLVECPLHGAQFDVKTGRAISPPADRSIKTFEVEVVDGKILVAVT